MGDFVYAISSAGITATNLTTLEETARIVLPQDQTLDDVRYDDVAVAEGTEGEGEERDRSSSGDEEEDDHEERGRSSSGDEEEGSSSPSRDR